MERGPILAASCDAMLAYPRFDEAAVLDRLPARAVVGDVDLVPLDRAVQDLAADIGEPLLRTLDALHLASAFLLNEQLTAFVAYDHRLTRAAQAAGMSIATPGRSTPGQQ